MKLRMSLIAVLLGLAMLSAGCGNTTTEEQSEENKKEKNEVIIDSEQAKLDVIQPNAYGNVDGLTLEPGTSISIIGRGKDTAYWNAVSAGAKKAVEEINVKLGYEGDDKVKVVYSAPEVEGDVDGQVNLLDEELARYPAAVGIAAVDMYACEVQFDLAIENNIPIIAFDAGTDYQNILSLVKTDDKDAARMAAKKVCDMIDDEGKILVVAHDTNSMTAQDREQSFIQQVKKKYENVEIAAVYRLDELETKKQELMKAAREEAESEEEVEEIELTHVDVLTELLEEHPDVKAIYATSESAMIQVEKTLGAIGITDMVVVSFDGGEAQLTRMENGILSGVIMQNPFGMGYATVVAAARAILGQGNEAVVDTGYTWVTPANMDDPTIQSMMY